MEALVVTFDKCPNQDAGAVRIHMFAKILIEIGYKVTVISMGKSTRFNVKHIENISYISYRSVNNSKFQKIIDYFMFPLRLKKFIKKKHYDLCLHTQIDKISLKILKKYCEKNNGKLLYDAVEWFSSEQFKNGEKSIGYKRNDSYNTKWIDKQYYVIAISDYLRKHFLDRGIKVLKIPVILDVKNIISKKSISDDKLVIMYAGSPGKKDYLFEILSGISLLKKEEQSKLKFVIIGVTREQLVNICGVENSTIDKLSEVIEIRGRIPRKDVLCELEKANFTILIRSEKQRYAKAGFPTKFVESLATGTPVISNLTSDLNDYLVDKRNGIIVDSCDARSICVAIKRTLTLSYNEKVYMCQEARKTAIKCFDYRLFVTSIKNFIFEIGKGEANDNFKKIKN